MQKLKLRASSHQLTAKEAVMNNTILSSTEIPVFTLRVQVYGPVTGM